jgi:DNA-binding NarL/FixJ family response regulator
MEPPIRLLLVDDEARVRQGLRMCMAGEPDFDVVGEAEEGAAAVHMAEALHPDVVVMDVRMAGLDGIGAAREMRVQVPEAQVVILSMHDDSGTRSEADKAGAAAFVGKQEGISRLFEVIRTIAGHEPRGVTSPCRS